jgi:hypothetical protein
MLPRVIGRLQWPEHGLHAIDQVIDHAATVAAGRPPVDFPLTDLSPALSSSVDSPLVMPDWTPSSMSVSLSQRCSRTPRSRIP